MTQLFSPRSVALAVCAVAALGAASAAQAHTDVFFSIGVPARQAYYEPAPVYVQPRPVYVEPRPVYVQPQPVYVQPPAYGYPRQWQPSYESRFEREQDWRRAEWHRHHGEHRHQEWDRSPSHGRDRD